MAARDRGVIDLTADCDTLDSARVPRLSMVLASTPMVSCTIFC